MRKYIIAVLMALRLSDASAQDFEAQFQLTLSDTASYEQLRWADFDNDSLLDVTVSGTTQAGKMFFTFYKNNPTSSWDHEAVMVTPFESADFILTDFNADNLIDIVITGSTDTGDMTQAYLNQENFTFIAESIMPDAGMTVKMGDLDRDGQPELILSGNESGDPFLNIYKRTPLQWELVHDSIAVEATSIEVFDFDKDGTNDLFISGKDAAGQAISQPFKNQLDFYFTTAGSSFNFQGRSSVNDLDHDGRLDVVVTGIDVESNPHSVTLFNEENGFIPGEPLPLLTSHSIFTGDLNSDGRCDISLLGITAASASVNLIIDSNGDYDTLESAGIVAQQFGDSDRDGDLDLLQLFTQAGLAELRLFQNTTEQKNLPPAKPTDPLGFRIFNSLFVFWSMSTDDHSPSGSLTYDITVQEEGLDLMSGTFDQTHGKRLLVNHGNTGTVNYVLLKSSGSGTFNYFIQSVDNAFHAAGNGVCTGTGQTCDAFDVQQIEACRYENTTLSAPENSMWFSLRDGLLHTGPLYTFTRNMPDTVFSVTPQPGGCPIVSIYAISIVKTKTLTDLNTLYVCEGAQVLFQAESGWEQVLWSSIKKGILSEENSIVFQATEEDTVKVELSDGDCIIERATAINISKPDLVLEETAYQVMKGESVQLNAGGGETYTWSPASGLDNPSISNPVATPGQTTEYVVVAGDSIGCTVEGRVLVIVEETAFIPNLFTPNEDGKNDDLRVYGLGTVSNFSFSIYNREGSLMYSTESTADLSSHGWNGMVRGVKQPSGVYYWKVKGENNTGKNILLNGRNTGSIMLIR